MSNYIIYTKDNGVLNFTKDLRIFIGKSDIDITYWNKIYTNLKDYYSTTKIVNINLAANKKKITEILIDKTITTNLTILTTLSFTTNDYANISEDDTITFTIDFDITNNPKSYTFTYPLNKLYLQCIQFFKTFPIRTDCLNKISIYLTPTFPLLLRRPVRKFSGSLVNTFIYVVSI